MESSSRSRWSSSPWRSSQRLQHRPRRARVRAPGRVLLRAAPGRPGPGPGPADPDHPAGGEGRPPRVLPRGAAPDLHHEGQRADRHRLPRLLKVFEPTTSVVAITDFRGASQALAATTLRAVIGDIPLDDVLAKREEINNIPRQARRGDPPLGRQGHGVEIREIVPPRDIQDAMNRQMSAERNRRAVITESEGTRQASINVAEGDKQSTILRAEGDKQSAILRAEGERRRRPCGPRATARR